MKDLNKIVSGLSRSGVLSGLASGAAGGALSSALLGKTAKKSGKKALKTGALMAVGTMAWKAYRSYSSSTSAPSSGPAPAAGRGNRFSFADSLLSEQRFAAVTEDAESENGQLLLMRAMIAAAFADGHIDAAERERIYQRVETLDLTTAEKALLFDEFRKPLGLEALVERVPDSETAVEVYAASLMAIDVHQPISIQYLNALATQLCLPRDLVANLHREIAPN